MSIRSVTFIVGKFGKLLFLAEIVAVESRELFINRNDIIISS